MKPRYPGYDVQSKRQGLSWNEPTRRAVDERLAVHGPQFLEADLWRTLNAVCARIVPQPGDRAPVPVAALVDGKLFANRGDGFRDVRQPPLRKAWQLGLAALDAEARARHDKGFAELSGTEQDALLQAMQEGALDHPAWQGMPPALFFSQRLVHDITAAYYAHPTAWSEIGFGGPASPRGYVRLDSDKRDAWEAAEARRDEDEPNARELNRRVR